MHCATGVPQDRGAGDQGIVPPGAGRDRQRTGPRCRGGLRPVACPVRSAALDVSVRRRLILSPRAAADLEEIADYIAGDNPIRVASLIRAENPAGVFGGIS